MRALSTRTRRWTTAVFAGLLAVGLSTIGQADAGDVVDGNPKCDGYDHSFKSQENPSGTISIDENGLLMTLVVGTSDAQPDVTKPPNPNNAVIERTVHEGSQVTSGLIIVKGSNGATLYSFTEAPPLHAPTNPSGLWPTISHVQVCWDEPDEPEYGRIELTKLVVGGEDVATRFVLCITGPGDDGEQVCQTALPFDTVTFRDLVPGTYAISEEDPGGNWVVTYSDSMLTVVPGGTASATVTNTWSEEPIYGSIEVTKAVTGDGAPTDDDFEVCITGPAPSEDEECETIGAGETAVFDELELGDYTVTETRTGLADNWTVTGEGAVVLDEDEPDATTTVTNTWSEEPLYGRLELTKQVIGEGAPSGASFTVCITGPTSTATAQCGIVTAGQTARFENLVPGSYVVTEPSLGTSWTMQSLDAIAVAAGTTSTATVVNEYQLQEQLPPTDVSPSGGSVTPTTQPQTGSLPTTGSDAGLAMMESALAAGLLACGAVLLRMSRRPDRGTG